MSGRPWQRRFRFKQDNRVGGFAIVVFAGLLVLPVWALTRLADRVDWRLLTGLPVAASLAVYFLYRTDKRRAEAGEWRIPEFTLHLGELLGGWPGAFLAQRKFRHKILKVSYQVEFWLMVAVHQYAALDFLLGWRLAKAALHLIKSRTA